MKYERKAHKLKLHKTSKFPTQFIFFDTETIKGKTEIFKTGKLKSKTEQLFEMGWTVYLDIEERRKKNIYKEEWCYFTKPNQLNKYVASKTRKKRNLYLVSANIWFDMRSTHIARYLTNNGYENDSYFVNGLSQMFKFKNGESKIIMLNLQNFFPTTVKALGKHLGLPKLDIDFQESTKSERKIYCRRDTEIILEGFKKWREFIKHHDFGGFAKTLPSQAFNAFRHKFYDENIYIHNINDVSKLERQSYFGARTECFFIGKIKKKIVYKLDINSFYPTVMSNKLYPVKLLGSEQNITLDKLNKLLDTNCVVAKVIINTKENAYITRNDKRCIFPTGRFITHLCSGSLEYALKNNHIERVLHYSYYEPANIFEKYISYMYQLKNKYKDTDNKIFYEIAKRFMNALYGKFGQRINIELKKFKTSKNYVNKESILDLDTDEFIDVVAFGGMEYWTENSYSESINSFVAIASHVTDYARMQLYKDMLVAGKENIYYMDTDSLFVNKKGYDNMSKLLDEDKLGYYKLEGKSKNVEIWCPKDYVFGSKVVIKGKPTKYKLKKDGTFISTQFPGFKSDFLKLHDENYKTHEIEKKLYRKYLKGNVNKNGTISPLVVSLDYS